MGEGLLAMIAANVQRDTRECYLLPDRRIAGWMDGWMDGCGKKHWTTW